MKTLAQSVYKFLFQLTLVAILSLLITAKSSAQGVQDFVVNSFDAVYELSNDDPQGLLKTTENIKLNFSGQNQGIKRAIPKKFGKTDTKPEVKSVFRDGKSEPFITYSENDNLIVQIGAAGTYITGEHEYEIVYQVQNVIRFYEDYDELYWDINGDQWVQPFDSISASLRSDARIREPGVICFTGVYGSKERSCEVQNEGNSFSVATSRQLTSGETLTTVTAFEKGYFTPAPWWEEYRNFLLVSPIIFLQAIIVRKSYKRWQIFGKDYKKRGVVAPYFGRPKNMSVMQASYVLENKLISTHITAAIIDLAVRGYIKIVERKEGRKTLHDLLLTKIPDDSTTDDEKSLVESLFSKLNVAALMTLNPNDLFEDIKVGDKVELESKKNKLYKVLPNLTKQVDVATSKSGFYELSPANSYKKIGGLLGAGILVSIISFFFTEYSSGLTAITSIITIFSVIVFSALMTKRSQAGNMMVEHMEGLKLYLNQAEKDRIKQQDAVEAPLAPHSGEPIRDVKFFEKLLPFAVAMGVEKTWSNAFKDIYNQPPEWYGGNWSTFSTAALAKSISTTNTATAASFSSPSSSGGSGFSGGGGSGGGGGGGGGGGW